MQTSTVIAMTAVVVLGIVTLLFLNFKPMAPVHVGTASHLPGNDVRGMAVFHNGIPYTLNFEQQKLANDVINRAVEVKKSDYPKAEAPFSFDKLVIYRFNAPDVEIFPISYSDRNLVFSVPSLSQEKYFLELSGGEFKNMINASFDQ